MERIGVMREVSLSEPFSFADVHAGCWGFSLADFKKDLDTSRTEVYGRSEEQVHARRA